MTVDSTGVQPARRLVVLARNAVEVHPALVSAGRHGNFEDDQRRRLTAAERDDRSHIQGERTYRQTRWGLLVTSVISVASAIAAFAAIAVTRESIEEVRAARVDQSREACVLALTDAAAHGIGMMGKRTAGLRTPKELSGTDITRDFALEQNFLSTAIAAQRCLSSLPKDTEISDALIERTGGLVWAFVKIRVQEPTTSVADQNVCILHAVDAYNEISRHVIDFVSQLRSGDTPNQNFVAGVDVDQSELGDVKLREKGCPDPSPDA